MQFSDETLMAYADGELDADLRREIEAAMALDPAIAERIGRHRQLRADLGAAFGPVLDEPMPARLLDAAAASPASKHASVTDLNAARSAKQRAVSPRKGWSWREWGAIAASMVIGVLAGRTALQPARSDLFATSAAGIVARGELSAALTDQVGGTMQRGNVHIGLTFRDREGQYCRTFVTTSAAGFACREDNTWKVRALNEPVPGQPSGEYRMAGTVLPPAVLTAVEDTMTGEALDQEQEQAARARDWNNK
ncbi:hypothetical protein JM946_04095 [Steroidobacter sp. S1-65]|uniref:Anti-sigma factor n=1 Tax=Steroidobacter gossypii TaxID=2805490 RepID=A0ABS1WSH9_9GAMM|nr:hypothetical protein [Steroidobacter gossypii]MBM0103907.1 hypothetical protein [Steroidobacter gossypii]